MVAHHPQRADGHGHPEVDITGAIAGEDIGLVELGPVHVDLAISTLDGVSPNADHAFDEVSRIGRRRETDELENSTRTALLPHPRGEVPKPAIGVAEHHDVTAFHASHVAGLLVDDHVVVHAARTSVQSRFHGSGRDEKRLDEEGLDDQRHHDDGDENRGHVAQERPAASETVCPSVTAQLMPLYAAGCLGPIRRRLRHVSHSGQVWENATIGQHGTAAGTWAGLVHHTWLTDQRTQGAAMTTAPIEQRRILATAIPGPRSELLQKRKVSAVSAGIGSGLPIYVERAGGD